MLHRLIVAVADAATARDISDRLSDPAGAAALATTVFEEQGGRLWRVGAYFPEPPSAEAILEALAGLEFLEPPVVEDVPDENWVAVSQAALPPVEAGRFLVHGSHDRALIGRRRWAIEIDAGEAFGTAHHASTEGCLLALERLGRNRVFRHILDLGSGSGVLAIAATRLWPRARVAASDIDPVAVEVARANVLLNRAAGGVALVEATGLAHPELRRARFDLVIANILAGPLVRMAPDLAHALAPAGTIILSGILAEQAREVVGVYAMAGFRLVERRIRLGWATLVLVHLP
ncbi:MAG: 50S ribosomal protein L11 methyltransferase [Hyphomicrobiaceae bacterium]|nr:50S ribosomal protein L11 methyltransferase [Hyphomicrobiaceae bacterium]